MIFNIPKPWRYLIYLFVAAFILAWAVKCRAADFEVAGGSAVFRGYAPTMALTVIQPKVIAHQGDVQYTLNLIGSSTFEGRSQPNQFALGAQIVNGFGPVDLGVGVAILQNDDAYNSGKMSFSLLLAYHWHEARLMYRHYSNAGTHDPNYGRDLILIGWSFK